MLFSTLLVRVSPTNTEEVYGNSLIGNSNVAKIANSSCKSNDDISATHVICRNGKIGNSPIQSFLVKIQLFIQQLTNAIARLLRILKKQENIGSEVEDISTKLEEADSKQLYSVDENIIWAGRKITSEEIDKVTYIKKHHIIPYTVNRQAKSRWILNQEIKDTEILRFLRSKHHDLDATVKSILHHDEWRVSEYGAESPFTNSSFRLTTDSSEYDDEGRKLTLPLGQEIFWLGYNKENCPTLVIRTQVHDGIYYHDDPKVYVR